MSEKVSMHLNQIPSEDRPMITNLSMLGLNVVVDVSQFSMERPSFLLAKVTRPSNFVSLTKSLIF
jgi:hypothetical protein